MSGESHRTKHAHEADAGNQHKRYHKDATRLRLSVVEEMEPEKLDYYWGIYAAEVGAKYGLQRGVRAKKGSKVSVAQVVRMAQILTPDTSQVKGNGWSGKVPLTGDQLEELYQIGRTGALSFSFEDHSLVDYIA